jgi:cytochrome c-type biogenesis protein CcmE
MHKKKRNRLISITLVLASATLGVYIILANLNENIVFFYPPSEIGKIASSTTKVRVGGIVKPGSIVTSLERTSFIISDHTSELRIEYSGPLPALFRENQGIVAEGKLVPGNLFQASRLLTKHDENYHPPELKNIKRPSRS